MADLVLDGQQCIVAKGGAGGRGNTGGREETRVHDLYDPRVDGGKGEEIRCVGRAMDLALCKGITRQACYLAPLMKETRVFPHGTICYSSRVFFYLYTSALTAHHLPTYPH